MKYFLFVSGALNKLKDAVKAIRRGSTDDDDETNNVNISRQNAMAEAIQMTVSLDFW